MARKKTRCRKCGKVIKLIRYEGNIIPCDVLLRSIIEDNGFALGKDCVYTSNGHKVFGYIGYDHNKNTYNGYIRHKCKKGG